MTADTEAQKRSRGRFIYADDEVIEKPFNWKQFARLAQYIRPYARQLLPLILAMIALGTMTKLLIPLLLGYAVDEIGPGGGGDYGRLLAYCGCMAVLFALQWAAGFYRIRATNTIGQRVIADLRSHLFRHIQKLSFRFFDKRPAGSVLVRVTNDVNSLQDLFTNGVVNLMIDLVQLSGIVIILLTLHFKLGLAIMITVPIMFFVSTSLRRRIRRAWQEVRMKQSRINAHLNESIQGIRVTQAFTQEKENMEYFDIMNTSNRKSWDKASAMNQAFNPIIEVTSGIGFFILFYYGAYLIQHGELTIGFLLAFTTYIGYFWEPINRLGLMYQQLLIAMASSERIFEFIDEEPTVAEKKDAVEMPKIRGNVSFRDVVFEYEKNRPALR